MALSAAILHVLQQVVVFDSGGMMTRWYFAPPWGVVLAKISPHRLEHIQLGRSVGFRNGSDL